MVSTHPIWAHTDFASFYYLVNLDYYYVYCYAVYSNDILKYNVDIYYIYIVYLYCLSVTSIHYFVQLGSLTRVGCNMQHTCKYPKLPKRHGER